jgi:hypothetical protein
MYPVKHKLNDCTMMKNFMASGALAKGKKPKGDPSRKDAASDPRVAAVMTMYG